MKSFTAPLQFSLTFLLVILSALSLRVQAQAVSGYTPAGTCTQLSIAHKTSGIIAPDGFTFDKLHQISNNSDHTWNDAPVIDWSRNYGGNLKDECYDAHQTSDGGYIMIGRSNSFGAGEFDGWLVKTDADGTIAWEKTFGDTYIDEANKVKETSDGGFIVAGMSTAFGWAGEGWLLRTDAEGNIIWNKGYHPIDGSVQSAWDYIYDVVETSDGGFVFAGNAPDVMYSTQAWIGKVDSDGNLLWDHGYGDIYWERIFSLEPTSDGGFIGVGDRHWTYDDITFKHDGWLLKFDQNGDTLWTKHFGDVNHDIFRSVKPSADGGYIIAGEREDAEVSGFRGWVVKTDAGGNTEWNQTFAPGGLYGVQQTPAGNFIVAGTTITPASADEGWLLKLDPQGEVVWEDLVHGTDMDDIFLFLDKTNDGGYVMGGKYNSNADACDYWLVKMDPEGLEPLSYFFEDFDAVTAPAFPENWSSLVDAMLSNTIAEVRVMEQGSTSSQPNAVFIMNGLNGSNGQLDTTVFAALVTPYVIVGNTGATLTFRASGGLPIQVGSLSNPLDPETFTLVQEVPLDYNFNEYTVTFNQPGTMYIALRHSNLQTASPLFVDDILFQQITTTGSPERLTGSIDTWPNPASSFVNLEAGEEIVSVLLFDLQGKQLMKVNESGKQVRINTVSLREGTYFLKCLLKDGRVVTRKLGIIR